MGGAQARPWLLAPHRHRIPQRRRHDRRDLRPLPVSQHLRLIEIAPGEPDDLRPLFGWTGGGANDPPLINSGCRSTRPHRMPRLARMERAR
jgi:hypothetical protein